MGHSISFKRLEKHFQENFIPPEAWLKLGIDLSGQLPEVPWSEKLLLGPCPYNPEKKLSETHILFLGQPSLDDRPLTVRNLLELFPFHLEDRGFKLHIPPKETNPWPMNDKDFIATETLAQRWYLGLKEVIPGSQKLTGKYFRFWDYQDTKLQPGYQPAKVIEEIAKIMLYFSQTGVRIRHGFVYGRCQPFFHRQSSQCFVPGFGTMDKSHNAAPAIGWFTKEFGLHIKDQMEEHCEEWQIGLTAFRSPA